VSRTGYTGEDGFEIYGAAKHGASIWTELVDYGVKPCGLGCRDTLRLEASLPLYGNDIDQNTTPLEAGLGFFVKLDNGDFSGKDVLLDQKQNGIAKKLCGFTIEGRGIPRHGYNIVDAEKKPAGVVTSGTLSPTLGYPVGMAYVDSSKTDTELFVEIRRNIFPVKIIKMPFYKRSTCC
ncbi:MAG: glycine cleavage system aminomethyltransferase GcvT, partial [Oligoflexia bacterium]|nr:glycine cleavage system aminomethyltransferase GcvT [Oligoflexia bacterium]